MWKITLKKKKDLKKNAKLLLQSSFESQVLKKVSRVLLEGSQRAEITAPTWMQSHLTHGVFFEILVADRVSFPEHLTLRTWKSASNGWTWKCFCLTELLWILQSPVSSASVCLFSFFFFNLHWDWAQGHTHTAEVLYSWATPLSL